jgi:Gnt-I system high-affinity gluconate transporter
VQLAVGILLLLFFLVGVVAVMRSQSPVIVPMLLVLMLLAILWAVTTGASLTEVLGRVIDGGATQYAAAVIIIVFGVWFGQVLVQTGIAESLIRSAVELAGDRPLIVAWVVSLVTGFLFTSLYGVGAAIGVDVIALPILMSMGIPSRVAAPTFTMAIGAGNYLNLVEFGIFRKFFPGIKSLLDLSSFPGPLDQIAWRGLAPARAPA